MKHVVKKDLKITEQISRLCQHYKFNFEVEKLIREITHNAYLKGFRALENKLKPNKTIANL